MGPRQALIGGEMDYERYAIYFTPAGAFGQAGASWLGWDIVQGRQVTPPPIDAIPLADFTDTPRKYGFHATIKPPFALAAGRDPQGLQAAFEAMCKELEPIVLAGLNFTWMGGFLALTIEGDTELLNACAAHVVRTLDPFRAPLSPSDLARRQRPSLTDAQQRNLRDWGYPHVMDSYRFHMTLTGRVPRRQREAVGAVASDHLGPHIPRPFLLGDLSLVGQGVDGMFHQIHRARLLG